MAQTIEHETAEKQELRTLVADELNQDHLSSCGFRAM